jgi:hypothetical protein
MIFQEQIARAHHRCLFQQGTAQRDIVHLHR